MKIEFGFDDRLIDKQGYDKLSIQSIIRNTFLKYDLPCISDDEILTFQDRGREDDFANMWNVIASLMKSQWFLECASSCVFYDDDGTVEDVLSQAWKFNELKS